MTKEIIIDDVNVAECKYYHYKGCSARGTKCDFENSNCYFKQLKRLKQENQKLNEALEEIRKICTAYAKTESYRYRTLQENEKLKEEIKQFTEWKRKSTRY